MMLMPSIFSNNYLDPFFDFDHFMRPMKGSAKYNHPSFGPMKTDVKETEAGYELDIELPGYKKEDVQAELKDGFLTIQAKTTSDEGEQNEEGKYIRRERYYGSCSRSFYVGEDIKQEDVSARFTDGILKLSIPKKVPQPEVEENHTITIEG